MAADRQSLKGCVYLYHLVFSFQDTEEGVVNLSLHLSPINGRFVYAFFSLDAIFFSAAARDWEIA